MRLLLFIWITSISYLAIYCASSLIRSYNDEYKKLQNYSSLHFKSHISATDVRWIEVYFGLSTQKRNRFEQLKLNALVFVKYRHVIEVESLKKREKGAHLWSYLFVDKESIDEWIIETEDPFHPWISLKWISMRVLKEEVAKKEGEMYHANAN